MKQLCVLLLLFAVGFTAVAGTDCWTYTPPPAGKTRGSIAWTDSSGFENVIKGVVLSGGQIRIIPGENKNSTTLRNADFSVPVRDEGGSELAYSPDFLAGKDNTGQSILAYIDGLTNVVMNANATSIGNYALKSNPNLVRVRLNDGLQSIGTQAFHQDTALAVIENFLPDSVKTLGKEAFRECKALVGPVVARGLETVGDRVFHTDLVLVGADLGGSTIETFPEYVFFTCPKLGSVVLPESTRVIGNGCFEACSSLTNVTPLLPPRLETLGSDSNPTWQDRDVHGGEEGTQVDRSVCVLPEPEPHERRPFGHDGKYHGQLDGGVRDDRHRAACLVPQPSSVTSLRTVGWHQDAEHHDPPAVESTGRLARMGRVRSVRAHVHVQQYDEDAARKNRRRRNVEVQHHAERNVVEGFRFASCNNDQIDDVACWL